MKRFARSFALFSLALASIGKSASAHDVLLRIDSPGINGFGVSVVGLDDIDGDGRRDFAVWPDNGGVGIRSSATGALIRSIPYTVFSPPSAAGDVDGDGTRDLLLGNDVYSPLTGALIQTVDGPYVAGIDDVDGDLRADFMVGTTGQTGHCGCDVCHTFCNGAGFADVVSSATGASLQQFVSSVTCDLFGAYMGVAGHVDGDSVRDVYVCGYKMGMLGALQPTRVFSGTSGALLTTISPAGPVCALGDIDGDGWGDLAVWPLFQADCRAISGADGSTLWTSTPPGWAKYHLEYFGNFELLPSVGDIDGDGVDDFIQAARQSSGAACGFPVVSGTGFAFLVSGASGAIIDTIVGHQWGSEFGRSATGLGDLDGDGRSDFVISAPVETSPSGGTGVLRIYSGAPMHSAPSTYCDGPSSGPWQNASIGFLGSPSVSAGSFALTAASVPPSASVVFEYGPNVQVVPFGGGSAPKGLSCVAAPVRSTSAASDSNGSVIRRLNLGAAGGLFAVGTTWNAQLIWRKNGQSGRTNALTFTVLP